MKTAKPILVLLLVFATGVITGVVGTRYVVRKTYQEAAREGSFYRDRMERELINQLDLSEPQKEQVRQIFAQSWDEFRQLRAEFHPKFTNVTARTVARIREVLTPEQRAEFERLLAEKKAMWRSPGGKPDRPGGPPHRERWDRTNSRSAEPQP